MTELTFLIELLLNGRLQKSVQQLVKNRIAEVEQNMSLPQTVRQQQRQGIALQTPTETQAITVQAAQALSQRQEAIQASINQKPIEVSTGSGTKGPRKF